MNDTFLPIVQGALYLGVRFDRFEEYCREVSIPVHTTKWQTKAIATKDVPLLASLVENIFHNLRRQIAEEIKTSSSDKQDQLNLMGAHFVLEQALLRLDNVPATHPDKGLFSLVYTFLTQKKYADLGAYITAKLLGEDVDHPTVVYDAQVHLKLDEAAQRLNISVHTLIFWCVSSEVAVHPSSKGQVVYCSELYKLENHLQTMYIEHLVKDHIVRYAYKTLSFPRCENFNWVLIRILTLTLDTDYDQDRTARSALHVHHTLLFWYLVQNHTYETFGSYLVSTMQGRTPLSDHVGPYDHEAHMRIDEAATVLKLDMHYFVWLCVFSRVPLYVTAENVRVVKRSELHKLEQGIQAACHHTITTSEPYIGRQLQGEAFPRLVDVFKQLGPPTGVITNALKRYVEQKHGDTISEFAAYCMKQLTQRSTAD